MKIIINKLFLFQRFGLNSFFQRNTLEKNEKKIMGETYIV